MMSQRKELKRTRAIIELTKMLKSVKPDIDIVFLSVDQVNDSKDETKRKLAENESSRINIELQMQKKRKDFFRVDIKGSLPAKILLNAIKEMLIEKGNITYSALWEKIDKRDANGDPIYVKDVRVAVARLICKKDQVDNFIKWIATGQTVKNFNFTIDGNEVNYVGLMLPSIDSAKVESLVLDELLTSETQKNLDKIVAVFMRDKRSEKRDERMTSIGDKIKPLLDAFINDPQNNEKAEALIKAFMKMIQKIDEFLDAKRALAPYRDALLKSGAAADDIDELLSTMIRSAFRKNVRELSKLGGEGALFEGELDAAMVSAQLHALKSELEELQDSGPGADRERIDILETSIKNRELYLKTVPRIERLVAENSNLHAEFVGALTTAMRGAAAKQANQKSDKEDGANVAATISVSAPPDASFLQSNTQRLRWGNMKPQRNSLNEADVDTAAKERQNDMEVRAKTQEEMKKVKDDFLVLQKSMGLIRDPQSRVELLRAFEESHVLQGAFKQEYTDYKAQFASDEDLVKKAERFVTKESPVTDRYFRPVSPASPLTQKKGREKKPQSDSDAENSGVGKKKRDSRPK